MSRSRLDFGTGGGQAGLEGGARATEQAVDRRLAGLEDLSGLGSAEAEHVAEHEGRALLGREMLKTRDERQRDCFLGLVARLRSRRGVGDALQQDVWVCLKPDRLGSAGRAGQLGHTL
jgi:hypothetical protein